MTPDVAPGHVTAELYRDEVAKLKNDPIITMMTLDVFQGIEVGLVCCIGDLRHDDGSPRYDFMMRCLHKYVKDGGEDNRTIGGVSRTVLALLDEWGLTE